MRGTQSAARRAAGLAAAAAMLAAAPPAQGGPGQVETPASPVSVGAVVEVTWQPLPAEVEEMELFLSLDGGATFPLRLTPQLAPGLRRLLWTVPPLPTPAARLRLRMGIPGRGEVAAEPSPPFAIVAAGQVVAAPVARQGGELWVGLAGDSPPPVPPSLGAPGEEVHSYPALLAALDGPRSALAAPVPGHRRGPPRDGSGAHGARSWPFRPGETTPRPLRR